MIVLLFSLSSLSFIAVNHAQLDNHGFISIDCGYTESPKYTDRAGITYVADLGFADAGLIHPVYPENMQPDLADRYKNIRYFPNGTRNCYTIRSLTPGAKYLVRAVFGYGNYDTLNKLPIFDLYLGVNYWTTVRIVNSSTAYISETISVSPANYLQVCLVNKGSGTPFIAGLDLRFLQPNLYPNSTETQSLVLLSFFRTTVSFGFNRYHFGTDDRHIRFPDDSYDRIWQRYEEVPTWTIVPDAISGNVTNAPNGTYDAPSAVMRSVSTLVNSSTMDLYWNLDGSMSVDFNDKYFVVLYFAEVETLQQNEFRQFDVLLDNTTLANGFRPEQMTTTVLTGTVQGSGSHSISLVPALNSKPPLISGMEIFLVRPLNESATDSGDATAMMTIQTKFSVKRNWAGDPCSPIAFAWVGLNCSYTPSAPSRITALYMSSSGLVGEIDPSFGQLTLLQHLDLSHNNLTGAIPDFLGQLPSLSFLDLSSNNLRGSIPNNLLQRSQIGVLTLRVDNNPNLCTNHTCDPIRNPRKRKAILIAEIMAPVAGAIIIVAVVLLIIWHKTKKRQGGARASNPFESRRFKYKELRSITDDFKNIIGKGGFGFVYSGKLEDGTPVAVKMRSQTSSQGNTEFLAEARHLAKAHHKNLVTLIGYCKDRKHLGLVYEYMGGGNQENWLKGKEGCHAEFNLTWLQRLKIALDSAYGLEYLHKSCSPPLIHRDVKTQNILLTSNLEAKIADFGLTRAFSSESKTHTTTRPAGTLGYLDPEYYNTSYLSEKSDVFSFGVVLLVLITGRPAIITVNNTERTNLAHWVQGRLSEGDIENVTDPRIKGNCDVNSLWTVAELALRCTEKAGKDRPTMSEVAEGLRESLQLETLSHSKRSGSIGTNGSALTETESVGALESEQIEETLPR
ncbi:LOW QUALITY PROTEIN: putative leucine-rich repeat receptor-like serine/threonine-protein kinase At2g19230 [Miscanthus floridulus]|uniref:LOW QUALITY PROTEIN: putative leucine-rich repeat receptor-like serine/threonine-protein kinase At2g19230 n=1 Tax=Miscanthus floridulus TaxID=154761 RepID=UPI00345755C6